MNKKLVASIWLITSGALLGFSALSAEAGIPEDGAFKKQLPSLIDDIKTANAYSWGVVGTPSDRSRAEKAIRILFKQAPDDVVVAATTDATPAGKMYVLCLLKKRHSTSYDNVKNSIDAKNTQVTVFSGSVLSKVPAEVVISVIEKFECDHLS
jgi:hypothetical protein